MLLRLFLIWRYLKRYQLFITLTLISHARCVDGLLFLLLAVADAVDGGEGYKQTEHFFHSYLLFCNKEPGAKVHFSAYTRNKL